MVERQVINGNEGDDIIYPGTASAADAEVTVNGGKGDDIINPWALTYDENDELVQDLSDSTTYGYGVGSNSRYGHAQTLRGGEGNDKIWGPF